MSFGVFGGRVSKVVGRGIEEGTKQKEQESNKNKRQHDNNVEVILTTTTIAAAKMKRKQGGGEEGSKGNCNGGINNSGNKYTHKKKRRRSSESPPPPALGTVATRTRGRTKRTASTWDKPITILLNILSYADPETLRLVCLVSKQFLDIVRNAPGMENKWIPLLQISPSANKEDAGRTERSLHQLYKHREKLQHYHAVRIIDVHKFTARTWWNFIYNSKIFQLNGVVSLDMSLPTMVRYSDHSLPYPLALILPNLRELNVSSTRIYSSDLHKFTRQCSQLETITCNNITGSSLISLTGFSMRPAQNLKKIIMDDGVFYVTGADQFDALSDMEDDVHSKTFIFHKCDSNVLERVSIRNARYQWYDNGSWTETIIIPQNALVKFVRNAPQSLRWF